MLAIPVDGSERIELLDVVAEDSARLVAAVRRFNEARIGASGARPLTVLARGALIGGVSGGTVYGHFLIEVVWVDECRRGQSLGKRLMELPRRKHDNLPV